MDPIRVIVAGAAGRMGAETVQAISSAPDFDLVAAVDKSRAGEDCGTGLAIRDKLGETLDSVPADVMVDFTHPASAASNTMSALKRNVAVVIGTSGLSSEDLSAVRLACMESGTPALLVPNFAIGAVLMIRFAELAAKWFPNTEIIELHHDGKADSPSGTATKTAELVSEARESVPRKTVQTIEKHPGARGANVKGIPVHSVRLPGYVAHQEVIFGAPGEILSIRHDSMDRKCFMEGVKLAVREVRGLSGFVVGLDKLIFKP